MFSIKSDISKNKLLITIDGVLTSAELPSYKSEMKKVVGTLKPGFTALLDLRKASVFDQSILDGLKDTKEIAVKAGLTKSAVLVASATLKMQMNRSFKDIGPQDMAFTDITEAEKFLLA